MVIQESLNLGNRLGDNADMAMIELVDFNELYNAGKPKKKSTRRSRRSGSAATEAPAAEKEAKVVEETKPEAEAQTDTEAKTDDSKE